MDGKKFDFDEEAALWDKNPGRVKLADDIAKAISEENLPAPGMNVLEFGCGTGLLTLKLHTMVHSITGVDSSPGMLGVLRHKLEGLGVSNITTRYLDPAADNTLEGSYDLIVCSMTLHHVKETGALIDQFFSITAPGGYLCIADLDPDKGRFHGDNDTVFHDGFDRESLRQAIEKAGFSGIRCKTAATVQKPVSGGAVESFSVFLMTGRKGPSEAG